MRRFATTAAALLVTAIANASAFVPVPSVSTFRRAAECGVGDGERRAAVQPKGGSDSLSSSSTSETSSSPQSSPWPSLSLFPSIFSPSQTNKEGLVDGGNKNNKNKAPKVLVLGGTGLVGREIVRLLREERNVPCVATSTDGRDGTIALDVTSDDAEENIQRLARKERCTALISAVGSLGGTSRDRAVNAADGVAARAARKVEDVSRFVCFGPSPVVAERAGGLPFLREYLEGKAEAEERVRAEFGDESDGCTIIKPTFVYGGDDLSLSLPPRLPDGVGAVADEVLGLYPLRALAEVLPGPLGLVLEPPVSAESAARAGVNAALGLCDDRTALDTKDDIVMVAARRDRTVSDELRGASAAELKRRREELKARIVRSTTEFVPEEDVISYMDELETLRPPSVRPVYDSRLNGRWQFVFTVEPDLGTGLIKQLLEGQSPFQFLFDLRGVCMEIKDEQSVINISVDTRVLGQEVIMIITTLLEPDENNPDGTMFYETFEGINLFGIDLPIPDSWKRSRYLEVPYLDDDLVIARGAGREPHFLLRESAKSGSEMP